MRRPCAASIPARRAACSRRCAALPDEARHGAADRSQPGPRRIRGQPRRQRGRTRPCSGSRASSRTAGVAVLGFEIERWRALGAGRAAGSRASSGRKTSAEPVLKLLALLGGGLRRRGRAAVLRPGLDAVPRRRPAEPAARPVRARRSGWCCRAPTAPSSRGMLLRAADASADLLIGFGGNAQDAEMLAQELAAGFPRAARRGVPLSRLRPEHRPAERGGAAGRRARRSTTR